MPTRSLMRFGSGLVLVATIAACGSPATASQTISAAPPTPTAAAGQTDDAPSALAPAGSVTIPSLGPDTPLVDLLPTELGGAATQKFALVGSDLGALDGSTAMVFVSLQNVLGTKDADMTIGAATNARGSVIAIRVTGKSAQQISDAMVVGRTLNATTTKTELDLGGKDVLKVTTTIAPVPFYVYGSGDVSFTISGADETIVTEALSKLP